MGKLNRPSYEYVARKVCGIFACGRIVGYYCIILWHD